MCQWIDHIQNNRDLITDTNETGLKLNEKDDTTFSSCIDSEQIVRNMCASQQYHHMSFFFVYLQSSQTFWCFYYKTLDWWGEMVSLF